MPDPRDILPLFPWEGPPIPRYLVMQEPPTARQCRYITILCMQLGIKEPLEDKVSTRGEAGRLIRELEAKVRYRKGLRGSNPNEKKVYTVLDSRGTPHTLEMRMTGFIPTPRWFLNGRLIVVDDRLGWMFPDPYGRPKQVRDKTLRDNIDKVIWGEVIPTGVDEEED